MIPTGIPLGRNPTGHGAGAVLWLKGSNLRSGIARAVNIPLECLLGSVLSFFWGGKHLVCTRIRSGSGRIWDLCCLFSAWEADFLTGGFEIPCARGIRGVPGMAMEFVPPKESFFFNFLQIPSVLEQH